MSDNVQITFRQAGPDDDPFLCELYASTRQEELAAVDWSPENKAAFLKMQYEAQSRHYRIHYAGADSRIILSVDRPIGRLIVYRMPNEVRIVDIALVPEFRGRGIGSRLIRELMAEAAAHGSSLTIHVEKFNPALRLYTRLGFEPVEDKGVYWFMEWKRQ